MENTSKITEQASLHDHLEKMSVAELLRHINEEDQKVARAVQEILPKVTQLIEAIVPRFEEGGRLFYMGAGTSGRLGILDASEIPPTYGLPHERVIGLIAGGDKAIRKAVEFAEDSMELAASDLKGHDLGPKDTVIGIAASGTTPYVIGALNYAREVGALTGAIVNNPGSPVAQAAELPIEVLVGPEFVTGSTRMKSGTSQKLVLNMISTALMIRMGRVEGNKMVHMQLNNTKLVDRGTRFLMEELSLEYDAAKALLEQHGSVKAAIMSQH
ncbi:MAG: N-acetylmuramic acid 6-phosphate etherase [Bacteroidota bacterium]